MTRRTALAALAIAGPAWGRARTPLERSFLQPWRSHLDWPPAKWERLLDWLELLSARQLILQWTSWNGIDYSELAARLASMLAARGMKLWLGLAFDEEFWRWPVVSDVETAAPLAAWRERSLALAARLGAGPARSKAFAGWYLPEEFDAARWGRAAASVAAHLASTRAALREIRKAPVAVSGFPSASPSAAAKFWGQALARRAVDELWLQDGIGAGKLTFEAWPAWSSLVAKAVRDAHCRPAAIVETFEVRPGIGFQAQPAPASRLIRQIDQAKRFSRGPLIAFDIANYMWPGSGDPALQLGVDYAASCGLAVPPNLLSTSVSEVR